MKLLHLLLLQLQYHFRWILKQFYQSVGKESKKVKDELITYESENGPIKVPAHPKRVILLKETSADSG